MSNELVNFLDNLLEADTKRLQEIEKREKISELKEKIYDYNNHCGSCSYWMLHPECPKEKRNLSGRKEGPSMSGSKCKKFVMEEGDKKQMEKHEQELKNMTK